MGKKMKLAIPFVLMGMCPIIYKMIGVTVDSNGALQEPFFLVPLGYIFFGIGVIQVVNYLLENRNKPKKLKINWK